MSEHNNIDMFNEDEPTKKKKKSWIIPVIAGVSSFCILAAPVMKFIRKTDRVVRKVDSIVKHIDKTEPTGNNIILEKTTTTDKTETIKSEKNSSDSSNYKNNSGIYKSGFYEVGKDIPEGIYIIVADGSNPENLGIAEISSSSDENDEDAVLNNTWFHGNIYLELEKGQFLHVSWATIYDAEKVDVKLNPYSKDGMYLVGKDIPAGIYELELDSGEYIYDYSAKYVIYSEMDSPMPIQFSNGNFKDNKSIRLEEGQYVMFEDCHPVEPVNNNDNNVLNL